MACYGKHCTVRRMLIFHRWSATPTRASIGTLAFFTTRQSLCRSTVWTLHIGRSSHTTREPRTTRRIWTDTGRTSPVRSRHQADRAGQHSARSVLPAAPCAGVNAYRCTLLICMGACGMHALRTRAQRRHSLHFHPSLRFPNSRWPSAAQPSLVHPSRAQPSVFWPWPGGRYAGRRCALMEPIGTVGCGALQWAGAGGEAGCHRYRRRCV